MRWRPFTWFLLSIACFIGAYYFWELGERWSADEREAARKAAAAAETVARSEVSIESASTAPVIPPMPEGTNAVAPTPERDLRIKYRVSNTSRPLDEFSRSETAVLLANALIDSSQPIELAIPDSLKSNGDPGSYVVQSRGPINDLFRAQLRGAGATVVSYIPNNAFLVRADESVAGRLASMPGIQGVFPFEPYYKLDWRLLNLVMEDKPVPSGAAVNVVLFPDAGDEAEQAIADTGAEILRTETSPFGPLLVVRPRPYGLAALAALPVVQTLSPASPRKPANDLSRARLRVAQDSVVETNHLNLTGTDVIVSVNDLGVDAEHPDLTGRVFANYTAALSDTNGHGTHLAGIIGSSGASSSEVTNAAGSILPPVDGQFRGIAPEVMIFSQIVEPFTVSNSTVNLSDFALQENAARSNAFISVNGWNYSGSDYDIAAANFDAAVRDALPGEIGSQPMVIVFPAGNAGNGDDNGVGVTEGSILSPATAKNVITVGALEQFRGITNEVEIIADGETNTMTPWVAITDSDSEVAPFSSRGNVGVQVEGDAGRFKPDLVAPGVMVVSTTRKDHWDEESYYNPTNFHRNTFIRTFTGGNTDHYPISLPYNTVGPFTITARALNLDTPLRISYRRTTATETFDAVGTNELVIQPGLYEPVPAFRFYAIGNMTNRVVRYEVTTVYSTTNDNGNYFQVLSNLNNGLGPNYRYESGSSMAAGNVAGMLALMQEYFTNHHSIRPSPALMKALLINGARTINALYDLEVRKELNDQGWGLPILTNSLPPTLVNAGKSPGESGAMLFFDQNPTNALATGFSRTFNVAVQGDGTNLPLRVTLVWTDPPGNPAAGIKLVNDLDLVVTNVASGEVFYGNDIPVGSSFTFPTDTNALPRVDNVNNVENVYLQNPVSTNYSVTVRARSVNVNAVPNHPDGVVQDFALVISSGNGSVSNAISLSPPVVNIASTNEINLTVITNQFESIPDIQGALLLNQHVGANAPLIDSSSITLGTNSQWGAGGTNGVVLLGVTNQWHFYTISNEFGFTNAAFATFLPPTLSLPRMGVTNYNDPDESSRIEADIDMYVSTDPGLLSLDPAALAAADKSLGREGTELITYSNSVQGQVYYIGIHAQDQQAAEYAFFGVFSLFPFSTLDTNGVQHVRGLNVPSIIPEGPPNAPGGVTVVGIAIYPQIIRRVVVTNQISHENMQNLFGVLQHNRQAVVLNNHSCPVVGGVDVCSTNYTFIYDDNGEFPISGGPIWQRTDGPGSLTGFIGDRAEGVWLMTEVDNSLVSTGRVETTWLRIEPQQFGEGTELTIEPFSFGYLAADVPPEATNMTIQVINLSANPLPLQLYVRFGDLPTTNLFDHSLPIPPTPEGATLSIARTNFPPLRVGRYYIGVYNPNPIQQKARVVVRLFLSAEGVDPLEFVSDGFEPILDDAVTYSSIIITNNQRIVRAEVGVAIQHPRVSDLVMTLLSPAGKRILLFENRGGPDTENMGTVSITTNFLGEVVSGGSNAHTNPVALSATSGTLLIDYDFLEAPDRLEVFYDGNTIFDSGLISGSGRFDIEFGPGSAMSLDIVMNRGGNTNIPTTEWTYAPRVVQVDTSYFIFSENTNIAQLPVKFGWAGTVDTNISVGDFESVLPGDFLAGATFEGWRVDSNRVSVVNDGGTASTGSNFVALAHGIMSRDLAVTPGQRYRLRFQYRGPDIVSWWRAEGSAFDSAGGNHGAPAGGVAYSAGVVGQAFNLNGIDSSITASASPSLNVRSMTIEGWINPTAVDIRIPIAEYAGLTDWVGPHLWVAEAFPGSLFGNIREAPKVEHGGVTGPGIVQANRWSHIAVTYNQPTGGFALYRDGVQVLSQNIGVFDPNTVLPFVIGYRPSGTPEIGAGRRFPGGIDELSLYRRALSGSEIAAIYSRTNAGKFDPDVATPTAESLAKAEIVVGTTAPRILIGENDRWHTESITFRADSPTVPVKLTGLVPGMLVDSFALEKIDDEAVFPEESLDVLIGDNAAGKWTLEVWDWRAGASNVAPEIVSWEMRFILETNFIETITLTNGVAVTNTIAPCQIAHYSVDVPLWAEFAINRLLFATPPGVNVWFNPVQPPSGTNVDDVLLILPAPSMGGDATLSASSTPAIVPGTRYYLGVENPCTSSNNVTYAIQVDFVRSIVTLTNMVPYSATNNPALGNDFFRYVVTPSAARAQFEINGPTGDMTLVAQLGLPPPGLFSFDYISANPALNDELIVVITNSIPVALGSGDWYITAINLSNGPVAYTILASEWPVTGRPFAITNYSFSSNEFCVTWNSLPGVHYYIEGAVNLAAVDWFKVSPTLTAGPGEDFMTYCIPLPSPYQFFRVVEGLALTNVPEPAPEIRFTASTNGYLLEWTGSITAEYRVQWASEFPPLQWNTFTTPVTSTNGWFQFLDDGSESGGLGGTRYYRVLQVR